MSIPGGFSLLQIATIFHPLSLHNHHSIHRDEAAIYQDQDQDQASACLDQSALVIEHIIPSSTQLLSSFST